MISKIRKILDSVFDPEVPVLTIGDLGILRDVKEENGIYEIIITPTYSGCPAMNRIADDIREAMAKEGIINYKITTVIGPAWTTDWMSSEGKRKLKEYGIAPPTGKSQDHLLALIEGKNAVVLCPFCDSDKTTLTSRFGSTACKALHYCNNCHQPFEEFKCH